MTIIDYCKTFTVKIKTVYGYGTGCLFQPNTENYSYVLTAKHLFENRDKTAISEEVNDDLAITRSLDMTELNSQSIYHHNELDLTIIKVDPVDNLDGLLYSFEIPVYPTKVALFGYPKRRGDQDNGIEDKFLPENTVLQYRDPIKKIEIEPKHYQNHGSIIGFSGCGVFEIKPNSVRLIGTEVSMVDDYEDAEGRMLFIPLKEFKSIITDNDLAELIPLCKSNFKYVVDKSFQALPNILKITKEILHDLATNSISDFITPDDVLNIIDVGKILINDECKSYLDHIHFWTVWLEFLVINRLILSIEEGESNEEWLDKLYINQHFLFVETKDWTTKLEDLVTFWRHNLEDKNKVLLVSSYPDTKPDWTIFKGEALVEQIGRVSLVDIVDDENIMNHIAEGSESKKYNFSHIHEFISQIIKNSDQFETNKAKIIGNIKDVINSIYNGN